MTRVHWLIVLAIVVIIGAIAVPNLLDARARVRQKDTMKSMLEARWILDAHREAHGAYPCPGLVGDLGECAVILAAGDATMDLFDAWKRPLRLIVTPDGAHALILSAGADGGFDAELGGPFVLKEKTRDFAVLDGSWFQFPAGYQCGPQCPGTIEEWVRRDRALFLEHWRADGLSALRVLHAQLLTASTP